MQPRLLLDTHVVVRWMLDVRKLSREQVRTLDDTIRKCEPVAISAISLFEIALLVTEGKLRLPLDEFFADMAANPALRVLPLSYEVAAEVAGLVHRLRDPADCIIVATARLHGLRLLTSDQRIIESNLVAVIE